MSAPPRRRVHLVALGCAKAQVDAEAGLGHLRALGYEPTDDPREAELLVVNTCSFIQPAIEESLEAILDLAEQRAPGQELVVAGCLVDRYGPERLAELLPEVDRFLPSGAFRSWGERRGTARPRGPALPEASDPRRRLGPDHYAYVKIAEGCDRRCSFCAIPAIRGRQRSRPASDLLAELASLAGEGVHEAVLVSQDTVRWGRDLAPRARLVELLAAIEAAAAAPPWVRLHYLYPEPALLELVEPLARGRRILPYVDVPIQHGSDRILRAMARGHTAADVERLVDALRTANPDVTLRTTVIVGFPGETPADLDALLALLERTRFDAVGVFTYWEEEGTAAAALPDGVPEEERYRRAGEVAELATELAEAAAARWVGRELEVLVDGRDPDLGLWIGRHRGQAPEVDGVVRLPGYAGPAGRCVRARITAVEGIDLIGEVSGLATLPPILVK